MRKLALIALLAASFAAMADDVQLRKDAPDKHIVVKGDTLWDISAEFLKTPWRWPEIWQNNKDHIKNPHWIYPGDVVYLVQTANGPRLVVNGEQTVKLSPTVHSEPIEDVSPIPTIPYSSVEAYLRRPILADEKVLAESPAIIGSADGRGLMTLGDIAYASGVHGDAVKWNIVRVGKELKDPDTGEKLAREVTYVGDATTVADGEPATLKITASDLEVETGDRLLAATSVNGIDFVPHVPSKPVDGKIISVLSGSQATSKYSTVIINKGEADGMRLGDVLAVYRTGRTVGKSETSRFASFDPKNGYLDSNVERREKILINGKPVNTKLPDAVNGHILIYRVLDRVAYGLVMDSLTPIYLLDAVRNP